MSAAAHIKLRILLGPLYIVVRHSPVTNFHFPNPHISPRVCSGDKSNWIDSYPVAHVLHFACEKQATTSPSLNSICLTYFYSPNCVCYLTLALRFIFHALLHAFLSQEGRKERELLKRAPCWQSEPRWWDGCWWLRHVSHTGCSTNTALISRMHSLNKPGGLSVHDNHRH